MNDPYFKKVLAAILVLTLLVLTFLILKPLLNSIIIGLILAFIFHPIYKFLVKTTKSQNLSATILSIVLILILILPIWFFTPILINEVFKIYVSAQATDFVGILKGIFPSIFSSEQFSNEIGGIFRTFIPNVANSFLNSISKFILNFPTLLLQGVVILFTFFFALRDKDEIFSYLKSMSPFSKSIDDRLSMSSKKITASIIYGQVIIGLLQGVIISIGFFLFGVPNALVLSMLATVAGILPIVGPMFIWVPVLIYLVINGQTFGAAGILIFGLISSNVDNILRPLFVSKHSKLHSSLVLIGMIGGLFLFGVIGLIVGPLILAYLLIIFEAFRSKRANEEEVSLIKPD